MGLVRPWSGMLSRSPPLCQRSQDGYATSPRRPWSPWCRSPHTAWCCSAWSGLALIPSPTNIFFSRIDRWHLLVGGPCPDLFLYRGPGNKHARRYRQSFLLSAKRSGATSNLYTSAYSLTFSFISCCIWSAQTFLHFISSICLKNVRWGGQFYSGPQHLEPVIKSHVCIGHRGYAVSSPTLVDIEVHLGNQDGHLPGLCCATFEYPAVLVKIP